MRLDFDTKKLAAKVDNNASVFIRKIAIDGLQRLIVQSPVDTGRFKANWSSSVGNLDTSTTEETTSNFSQQSKGIRDYKVNQPMFLHNNLEYAIPLEYGSSKQAPKGWIRNTANLLQKKLNEIKDLI